jgi:hypothetical protein
MPQNKPPLDGAFLASQGAAPQGQSANNAAGKAPSKDGSKPNIGGQVQAAEARAKAAALALTMEKTKQFSLFARQHGWDTVIAEGSTPLAPGYQTLLALKRK